MKNNQDDKLKIYKKFVEIAKSSGICEKSLDDAMISCGFDKSIKNIIFENGVDDLIELYTDDIKNLIEEKISTYPDFDNSKIRDKIRLCLYSFFDVQKQQKDFVAQLYKFYFKNINFDISKASQNIINSTKNNFDISDFIWKKINDKSTDFNYYSKRLILLKIISHGLFIFLNDNTENLDHTKSFIDNEILKVMKFEKLKFEAKKLSNKICEYSKELIIDEKGEVKSIKDIAKNLPFIRLFKKNKF